MAMTTCAACGKRVSTIISTCSLCGAQLDDAEPEEKSSLMGNIALHLIGASVLLVAAGWLWMEGIGGAFVFVLLIAGAAWYGAVKTYLKFRRGRRSSEVSDYTDSL